MGARGAPAGAAHARPAPAREPTDPRQPRTGVQGPGMLQGIHPIAEPPARGGVGPAAVPGRLADLRAEHARTTSEGRRLTRESEGPGSATGWTPAGDIDPPTGRRAAACEAPKRRGGLATRACL